MRVPTAIALTICEQLIVEEGTRKLSLVNNFFRRFHRTFPARTPPMIVVAMLTGGQGAVDVELVVQRLDTLEHVYRRTRRVTFRHPLQELLLTYRVVDLSFPVPGRYDVSISTGGEPIARRALTILQRERES